MIHDSSAPHSEAETNELSHEGDRPIENDSHEIAPLEQPIREESPGMMPPSLVPAQDPAVVRGDDMTHLHRGPKFPAKRARFGASFDYQAICEASRTAGVPLAVVGPNAAKVKTTYRVNLEFEALKGALEFDPATLTAADREKELEFIVHDRTVAEPLDAVTQNGLNDKMDLHYAPTPIILEARLSRVPPNTPSISVAWPANWPAPVVGRTKAFVVPVIAIRFRTQSA